MNDTTIAIVGGLAGMFGYGISDFFAKKTIDRIGDLRTLFYTQLFGALFISFYFLTNPSLPVFSAANSLYIFLFGFFNFVGYLALYRSFEKGKMTIVSPIASSYTVLVAITSFLFFGEFFSPVKLLVLLLVITGVFATAVDFKKLRDGLQSSDFSKGVPHALVSLLIFGLYIPFWDKFLEGSGWVVWVILVRLILAVVLLLYSLFIEKKPILFKGWSIAAWLVLVAFFEAAGSFGSAWAYSASANTTSVITALISGYSLVTAVLAFIFLKERLVLNQYIGVLLIIAGLILMPLI